MKKTATLFATLVLLFSTIGGGFANSRNVFADDVTTESPTPVAPLVISRINPTNSSEFLQLYNPTDIDFLFNDLQIQVFNSNGNLTKANTSTDYTWSLPAGMIGARSYILFAENNISADQIFAKDTIVNSGGAIKIFADGEQLDSVCWGNGNSCVNHAAAIPANQILQNDCLADNVCVANGSFSFANPPDIIEAGGFVPAPTPEIPLCEAELSEIGANLVDQFIEVANPTDHAIDLGSCTLKTNRAAKIVQLSSMLNPGDFAAFAIADLGLTLTKTTTGTVDLLNLTNNDIVDEISYANLPAGTSFANIDGIWQVTANPTPGFANALPPPVPINPDCAALQLNEIGANLDTQFIEIFNPTDRNLNLLDCQVHTNRSTTKFFAFGDETLPAGSFRAVNISDTDLTLTKTTSGAVYLGDAQTDFDEVSYANLAAGTSFAKFDDGWKQTFVPTPGEANIFQLFANCQDGYFRNEETGRCNKNPVDPVAKVCADGYWLNLATNRCNKDPVASALKPCNADQYRNLLTNRCNNIVTTTTKDCPAGQERNLDTNRCRTVGGGAAANYSVKPTNSSGGSSNWLWIVGGAAAFIAALIVWQFRDELGRLWRKFREKVHPKTMRSADISLVENPGETFAKGVK